jgi:hypothetical protein
MPTRITVDSLDYFVYLGCDANNYIIDANFTVDVPYSTSFANAEPFGVIG